jgi:hypothetical protein
MSIIRAVNGLVTELIDGLAERIARSDSARTATEQHAANFLATPDVKGTVARMARSEVKNYLAELAEEAEIPFANPAGFLRAVQLHAGHWTSTGDGLQDDGSYDASADAPFNVIDTLPNGHTATCSCPDKDEHIIRAEM